MEIYGFSWLLKLLAAKSSKTYVMQTYLVSRNEYIDFGVTYDGHIKLHNYQKSLKMHDKFKEMLLKNLDPTCGKL